MQCVQAGPFARLMLSAAPNLLDSEFAGKVAPGTPHARELGAMIEECGLLIQSIDLELGSRLTEEVRWFFPLLASDGGRTHNSFTIKGLSGVMFLSEAYEELALAEAMVHEFHHAELYLLQETTGLWESDDGRLYYSPWRPDPRPLEGLFHAIYVFAAVARFLCAAEANDNLANRRARIAVRRNQLVSQLRLAIAQLRDTNYGELASLIIQDIAYELDEQEARSSDGGGYVPASVLQHWTNWRSANPSLAGSVVIPDQYAVLHQPVARPEIDGR